MLGDLPTRQRTCAQSAAQRHHLVLAAQARWSEWAAPVVVAAQLRETAGGAGVRLHVRDTERKVIARHVFPSVEDAVEFLQAVAEPKAAETKQPAKAAPTSHGPSVGTTPHAL